ncbi:cyclic nucleotide-binding domain-containing protein [bacterium]|nr:MAG: cyclic nucleotide-binding domain-containing protein [bacterium]
MSKDSKPTLAPLWGNVFNMLNMSKQEGESEILKKIPIFQDLNKRELKIIARILYERTYEAGEYMFETGQPGAAMFIIKDGQIQITRNSKSGEELVLATIGNGEFVGELALLDSSPRSASAFVTKQTIALAIFRSDLEKLFDNNPELGNKVMRRLATVIGLRLKATNDLLINLEDEYATASE